MMATTSHHCLSGMYEISGRLIFVEQSVHSHNISEEHAVSIFRIDVFKSHITLFYHEKGSGTFL